MHYIALQVCAHGIFGVVHVPGHLECLAQKLATTVVNSQRAVNALFAVLAELFDTWLRIFTRDASRKMFLVIPTSMEQHLVNVDVPHKDKGEGGRERGRGQVRGRPDRQHYGLP